MFLEIDINCPINSLEITPYNMSLINYTTFLWLLNQPRVQLEQGVVRLQSLQDPLTGLLPELVAGQLQLLERLGPPQQLGDVLGAVAVEAV